MNEELQRRISDALDAPGGLEADEDLRALLEGDADAAGYAADLQAIDGALGALGEGFREPDWDALADRIDAQIEAESDGQDALEPLDVTAPPTLSDDLSEEEAHAAAAVVTPEAAAHAPAHAAQRAASPGVESAAPVVDLAARRRRRTLFAAAGGLAAAAAVALGVTAGLSTMQSEAPVAMGPAATETMASADEAAEEAPAEPRWQGPSPASPAAEMESDLGAAAVAEPALAEMDRYEAEPEEPTASPTPDPDPSPPPMGRRAARSRGAGMQDSFAGVGASGGGGGSGGARTATGSGASAPSRTEPSPTEPSRTEPSRREIVNALQRVEPAVQRCIADRREVARVIVVVEPSGQVSDVQVSAPHAGTPAEACIVRAVQGARLPASGAGYRAAHPFRPAPVAGGTLSRPPASARRAREAPATSLPARTERR